MLSNGVEFSRVSPDGEEDGDVAQEGKEEKDTQRECYPVLAFL